jgi:cell division protein FtsN
MSRDYKPRPQGKKAGRHRPDYDQKPGVALWKWMLITAIIISFAVFLVYLWSTASKPTAPQTAPNKTTTENTGGPQQEQKADIKLEPKLPQFDFYTILPEKEVVVPEYEIKTRTREERVGKAKETHYIMQAGSFKTFKEADQLRAKLASMGINSKVQKGKVGIVNWYRVKMGPYAQADSINAIRARLRKNGIDIIITEAGE